MFLGGVAAGDGIVADGVVAAVAWAGAGFGFGEGLGQEGYGGLLAGPWVGGGLWAGPCVGGGGDGFGGGVVHVFVEPLPHAHELGICAGDGFPAGGKLLVGIGLGLAGGVDGLDANGIGVAVGSFIAQVGDEQGGGGAAAALALDGGQ